MKKLFKLLGVIGLCVPFLFMNGTALSDDYKPRNPVEKINKSLTVVEKRVRNAAVKVMAGGGHGSGTVMEYKDLTIVLTARHVADGPIGMEYLVSTSEEQRNAVLVYQSQEHDIAVLVLKKDFHRLKPMPWKPTKNYDVGSDIVYSGHPSWHKLMSFQGRIVGYEEVPGSGTQLIVNTYGWFGCSGSGVYNTDGEIVGILFGVDVQYRHGAHIQENMIWVAPIKNINIDTALDSYCRGSVKNYKACK